MRRGARVSSVLYRTTRNKTVNNLVIVQLFNFNVFRFYFYSNLAYSTATTFHFIDFVTLCSRTIDEWFDFEFISRAIRCVFSGDGDYLDMKSLCLILNLNLSPPADNWLTCNWIGFIDLNHILLFINSNFTMAVYCFFKIFSGNIFVFI